VRELAARVTHESKSTAPTVIINCMTPGACKSDFDRESTGIGKMMSNLMSALLARTTEVGSRTLVAGVAAGEESHGTYMADCRIAEYVFSDTL
jgi:retinol dehydrogenase 12